MRVAVDAHAVAQPSAGDAGNARWIENLIHALTTTADAGDEVCAMVAHAAAEQRIDPGVPLLQVGEANMRRLTWGAPRAMERAHADVGVFNYVVPFRGRTPSAVVVHDAAFITNPEWFSRRDKLVLGKLVPSADVKVTAPRPTLSLSRTADVITVTFTGSLQSSTSLTGPFSNVTGATSPYAVPAPPGGSLFFRSIK